MKINQLKMQKLTALNQSTKHNVDLYSKDYEKFNFLSVGLNRPTTLAHIKVFIREIENTGIIDPVEIFRNKDDGNFYIYDGQNRFMAYKTLDLPVFFKIRDIKSVDEALTMLRAKNRANKNWTTEQFMDSFASQKLPAYVKYKNVFEKNKHIIKHAQLRILALGFDGTPSDINYIFNNGALEIASPTKLQNVLNDLNNFYNINEKCVKNKHIQRAYIQLINNEEKIDKNAVLNVFKKMKAIGFKNSKPNQIVTKFISDYNSYVPLASQIDVDKY